ncbi:MAG TPA: enterochelin esterase domain-containing protein [Pyrinomonadaceae bacterium]
MRVPIARKIIRILFTLLIMLNAILATKVFVSATSSTRPSGEQQSGNAPANQEIATTVDDRHLSPRLATLWDHLKSGDRKALAGFWKEITESGAPIVEEVPGNDRDVLVTILWRATEETRSVFVFQLPGIDKAMARLPDTELWYRTFRLQKGARFVYRLATNLPDPKEWTSLARFGNAMRSDPLNPLQFAERANELNPYEVTFFPRQNCHLRRQNTGASPGPKFLPDACSATNSTANSSAMNVQFGFTLHTATLLIRSLMDCCYFLTAVFTSTRRT